MDSKEHWNNIYNTKKLTEVSWYQPVPETSMEFFRELGLPKDANIIDIGGGDSFLVDHLLKEGYKNITVLDISQKALERAKLRLGEKAEQVNWIEADAANFQASETYDLWHDRAAFHFLTEEKKIESYLERVKKQLNTGGFLILGTFSEKGPEKCSGISIRQYSLEEMRNLFSEGFEEVTCKNVEHHTPSGAVQHFSFCSFKKM